MAKDKAKKKEELEEETIDTEEANVEETVELSDVDILSAKVKDLEAESHDWKTKYYKVFADMENLKRRLETEHQNALKFMMQDFAQDLLPVIDNLERACNIEEPSDEIAQFLKGFEMINKQFLEVLSKNGIDEIKATSETFDPNFHQAVMTCNEADVDDNIVVEELQKGYTLNGRVLRASLVKVNQK